MHQSCSWKLSSYTFYFETKTASFKIRSFIHASRKMWRRAPTGTKDLPFWRLWPCCSFLCFNLVSLLLWWSILKSVCKVLGAFDHSTDGIDELRQKEKFSRFEDCDHVVLFCASIEFLFYLLLFFLFFFLLHVGYTSQRRFSSLFSETCPTSRSWSWGVCWPVVKRSRILTSLQS